ncbi:hypothetical protein EVAR_8947_1 [Eumeta japonica]|uniref:Uncharacterized protein n=1 Tax=Eumeta variegata TaxID=151549 RepID=A0A4C1U1T0_EUMVA|nr:hypothetical protein EVAR_8947_1 [Eumeta japonica]
MPLGKQLSLGYNFFFFPILEQEERKHGWFLVATYRGERSETYCRWIGVEVDGALNTLDRFGSTWIDCLDQFRHFPNVHD